MPNLHKAPFRVAIAQAAPVFLDRAATLEKACELIVDAGHAGARLIVFPAAFLPGYPAWIWSIPPDQRWLLNELRTQLLANAVSIPSDTTDRLCRIAQRARINVVMGISECDSAAGGTTYYNTLLYIDARGQILGKHRSSILSGIETRLHPGDSVVVNPNGEYIAGPVREQEMLLYADIDLRQEHR
jgi:nitrilase